MRDHGIKCGVVSGSRCIWKDRVIDTVIDR